MEEYQSSPLKLYIQDIFRAEQTEENKYVYKLFNYKFKNIMIHGIVTEHYNTTSKITNLELSDPTGCIQVFYDSSKRDFNISEGNFKHLVKSLSSDTRAGNNNIATMASLLNSVEKKYKNPFDVKVGSFVSVIGDIFVDKLTSVRMISAYQCVRTSVERDIVWLEELRYLYDNYYLKSEVDTK